MSLHAQPSPEALVRLQAQRRNAFISSLVIALLAVILVVLVLGVFFLPNLVHEPPTIVTYQSGRNLEPEVQEKKIQTSMDRKPSSPSASMARVITAQIASPTAIQVPEVDISTPSLDFGDGHDFGSGWGGPGGGSGGGSMFGSSEAIPGALKGRLFDFKQSRRGKAIDYDSSVANFAELVASAERRDFNSAAFSKFFTAPNELHLTNLAIPFTPAAFGPEYFGAKETIKPSGWVAVYQGAITAPVSGAYRFRGASDDFLVVLVEGRRNLVACWPDLQQKVAGRWRPGKMEGSDKSPLGSALLHAGEWMNLRAGEPVEITIAVGERPGGMVGFLLEIEEQGREYRTDANGRKILPLFTTKPFTSGERAEIGKRFGDYEFEWEDVPVFGIR